MNPMKTTLLFLALLCGAQGQTVPEKTYTKTTGAGITYLSNYSSDSDYCISLRCGLSISMSSGAVTIPKDVSLDTASREFWKAIEMAYPHAIGTHTTEAEAADVVLALKVMDAQREWIELLTQYLLSDAPLDQRLKRAKEYAVDKPERDKRIAWARTILAKWEGRAK